MEVERINVGAPQSFEFYLAYSTPIVALESMYQSSKIDFNQQQFFRVGSTCGCQKP